MRLNFANVETSTPRTEIITYSVTDTVCLFIRLLNLEMPCTLMNTLHFTVILSSLLILALDNHLLIVLSF